MDAYGVEQSILDVCGARSLRLVEKIQSLWGGYGVICRYNLQGSALSQVVVKHVRLARQEAHPKGWNTILSHRRKIQSYEVESAWYQKYNHLCSPFARTPVCYGVRIHDLEWLMVLEDLQPLGLAPSTKVTWQQMSKCLEWLAYFHSQFLGVQPHDLWAVGTYWHLATRPDELESLTDRALYQAATAIDKELSNCPFQTLVHGDAKLANFCFGEDQEVAAVDFQYVGGGCGMKDVAYFIGSCLDEAGCDAQADNLLDVYFEHFHMAMKARGQSMALEVERSWRPLFPVAWADFHRFLKGWSPSHWKAHGYSERITTAVIKTIQCPQQYPHEP